MNYNVHNSVNPLENKNNVNISSQEKQSVICLMALVSELAFFSLPVGLKKKNVEFKSNHEMNTFKKKHPNSN